MTLPSESENSKHAPVQYSTFTVANRIYGIEVSRVQEIVLPLNMTQVPLAPKFVRGLINLRGQVATAIGLRELFGLDPAPFDNRPFNVVCRLNGVLLSLLIDEVGDVVEVGADSFEKVPSTIPTEIRRFLSGVHMVSPSILSIIDLDKVIDVLNTSSARTAA